MLKYSTQHEWVAINGDIGTIGITHYAQSQLGDVVFTDLPAIGKKVFKGSEVAVVESVKAASEVYTPVSGEIIEVNEMLASTPDLINESPEEKGWFFKIKFSNVSELDTLLDEAAYKKLIGE